ncbi:family 2 glycosyl transferase [Paenibacillus mucilaginosus 3016]|uniref:Family 2 glycosyl transferase n=2 Tax=Paenibacillus mucilaginosus TaxID=61624 RepID=H6NR94_9BACL|nr:glycosyltransferase family 2 protein [Paenibacillus mucilaginosus]AFC32787.1 family 2 glycosyl transferase [Paenibacillus mucilaginosus 3016]AFH65123.1 glycosyl transferase family 2 [Paenibacillus mucilaginosus K02]AFK65466.1 glycosyltransferase group 2 family protein [Paenibacillus mucilaginosus K02]WFA21251.1 glycosyltransferase family 2 protein [Paenibacillus mucilaginosus]
MQKASIVIPHKDGLPLLVRCIDSIRRHTETPYEIIVVDNGSRDGSVEYCLQAGVRLISSPSNRGFPAACNLGMQLAGGDAVLLLNNDVVVAPRWLTNLMRCLYASEDMGLVGPVTNYASGVQMVDTPYNTPEQADSVPNEPDPAKWQEVRRLIGFCLLFKRETMERIGLLDEAYSPGHFEDDDYCYRARAAGYRLMAAGDTFVYHQGSASFGQEPQEGVKELIRRNREIFMAKWGVDPQQFI